MLYITIVLALWLLAFLVFSNKTNDVNPCEPISNDIRSLIISKACYNHIDPELLLKIAECESGFQIDIKNKRSSASGLFQFLDGTFFSYAQAYELPLEKNNPEVQAELAAKMISNGGLSHWNASRSCWQ